MSPRPTHDGDARREPDGHNTCWAASQSDLDWNRSDLCHRTARCHRFLAPRLGARWESAEPAAVFDDLLVRPSLRTLEAALAARGLVLRCVAIPSPRPTIAISPFERRDRP